MNATKCIKKFIEMGNVNLGTNSKNRRFDRQLKTSISFLFSFVFGFGLQQLHETYMNGTFTENLLPIITGYVIIFLSWIGYNRALICRECAPNYFTYLIDCILLFAYWALLNFYDNYLDFLITCTIIYFLYTLWEVIRIYIITEPEGKDKKEKKRVYLNLFFMFFFVILSMIYFFTKFLPSSLFMIVTIVLTVLYRLKMKKLYKSI